MTAMASGQELHLELIQQLITEGLVRLSGDSFRLQTLLERFDTMKRAANQGPEQWTEDATDIITKLARLGIRNGGESAIVGCYYPEDGRQMPYVSIVTGGARSEDEGFCGRVIEEVDSIQGGKVYKDQYIGSMWRHTVEIGCWSPAIEEARILKMAVQNVLEHDWSRLRVAGVLEVDFSESGFAAESQTNPSTIVLTINMGLKYLQHSVRRIGPVAWRVNLII